MKTRTFIFEWYPNPTGVRERRKIRTSRERKKERKNKVIQEMAKAMLHNKDVARNLWGEAVNTVCHTVNRVYFRLGTKKTPYELWKGRKPNVKYFRIFGTTCFILKDRENEEAQKITLSSQCFD